VLGLRALLLGLGVLGALALVDVGRRLWGSLLAGVVGAAVTACFSYVAHHGASARFDPLLVNLFLVAAALALRTGRASAVGAATALALAAAVSLKAVFYGVPWVALVVGATLAAPDRRACLRRHASIVAGALALAATLYVLHAAALAPVVAVDGVPVTGLVPSTPSELASRMLREPDWFPRARELRQTLRFDRSGWAFVVMGLLSSLALLRGPHRGAALVALGWCAPLGALAVYRNAFPYFYVAIVPLAGLAIGATSVVLQAWCARRPRWSVVFVVVIVSALLAPATSFAVWARGNSDDRVTHQRRVLDAIHAVFPTPVPYIDRCSMVSSWPKVGPFLSTWGLDRYRSAGQPLFPSLLAAHRPLLLVQNAPALQALDVADEQQAAAAATTVRPPGDDDGGAGDDEHDGDDRAGDDGAGAGRKDDDEVEAPPRRRLLPADARALREGFVPWWGPLRIAGARVDVDEGGQGSFSLATAGDYVVDRDAIIDGRAVGAGGVVSLTAGAHALQAGAPVLVRTAAARPPPTTKPPRQRLFDSLRPRVRSSR
jgi:hypothetical protein